MNDTLRMKLMKLLALAERGVGGEAVNARALLESALKKHGIALDDLTDGQRKMQRFTFKGLHEERILIQIMVTVCGSKTKVYGRKGARALFAEMTQEQVVETEMLWAAHRTQFKKEMDILISAYIHKQNLFPRDVEKVEKEMTPEDLERLERIVQMMMGIQTVEIRRQLCARG
jgi:hypothetical protein